MPPEEFPQRLPEPPRRLLAHYRDAQRRFGVPWHVLAAVNFVESGFGRLRNSSDAARAVLLATQAAQAWGSTYVRPDGLYEWGSNSMVLNTAIVALEVLKTGSVAV